MKQSNILTYVPEPWQPLLSDGINDNFWAELEQGLSAFEQSAKVYPPRPHVFEAFKLTPPHRVKVVIVGQDPYHGPGQANGIAFSVHRGQAIPPSLRNIFKELNEDTGASIPCHGDLSAWAQQGVLLINQVLTVSESEPNSHDELNWQALTSKVIQALGEKEQPIAFVLWGKHAQKFEKFVQNPKHLVIKSPHPSPLSAYRGFFGSRPFSTINEYLSEHGLSPINWDLD